MTLAQLLDLITKIQKVLEEAPTEEHEYSEESWEDLHRELTDNGNDPLSDYWTSFLNQLYHQDYEEAKIAIMELLRVFRG